jgi:hypothetical protein
MARLVHEDSFRGTAMKKLLTGIVGIGLWCGPVMWAQGGNDKGKDQPKAQASESEHMSADMREAIEFERAKDRADAQQARMEARHPSVPPVGEHSADRSQQGPGSSGKATGRGPGSDK